MNRLVRLDFLPRTYDFGLLLLRVWAGFTLFWRHGIEKVAHFSTMASHFPDPVHIGSHLSLVMALISDAICSILLILGLAARWAALYIAIILGVAFALVHHFALSGPHSGELPFLYCGIALALFFTGPGRFSVDGQAGKPR